MSQWEPQFAVMDKRFLASNLLTFIKANQGAALKFFNDNQALAGFVQFSDSVANRAKPKYPSLAVTAESFTDRSTGDLLEIDYLVRLEGAFLGNLQTVESLAQTARIYGCAVESMMVNIPKNSLVAGANQAIQMNPAENDLDLPQMRENTAQTEFLQKFVVQVKYELRAVRDLLI